MKGRIMLLLAVAALLVVPTVATAAVVGSAHDLPAFLGWSGTQARQGTCSFCHVPHKAQGGDKLFPDPYSTGLPPAWSSDSLMAICYACHGVSGTGAALDVNPFQGSSAHARLVTKLTDGTLSNDAAYDDIAAVNTTTLRMVGNELRCVSCHIVHDNTEKPFLRWGTRGDFSSAATGFCQPCHANRNNATSIGANNTNGMHPSFSIYSDGTTGGRAPLIGTNVIPSMFQVNMTALTNAKAGAWNLGGHAYYQAAGATEQNTMVCGSCHLVHSNETATYTSETDGGCTVGSAIVLPGNNLLPASELVPGGVDTVDVEAICEACHSVAPGDGTRGPGAVNTFSHPTGTVSAWATNMNGNRGYKWVAGATNQKIICQSCHDVHWSICNKGTANSGFGKTGQFLVAYSCDGCHSFAGAGMANHHPSSVTVTAGAAYGAGVDVMTGAATTSTVNGDTNWIARTQTKGAPSTVYFSGTSIMNCDTCHGLGTANGAHNNALGFPGLSGRNVESDMCVDCHSFNPSQYTPRGDATRGQTHYEGTVGNANYKYTASWAVSNYSSIWGPDGGAANSIICESCHSLKINGRNGHSIVYQASNNSGTAEATVKSAVILLVRKSGNRDSFAAANENLCTGCHGATPGGNKTHPVLPTYSTAATTAVSITSPATLNVSSMVNCESCHRPHDAITQGGSSWGNAWILESGTWGGTNTYTDFSPVCRLCHTTQ